MTKQQVARAKLSRMSLRGAQMANRFHKISINETAVKQHDWVERMGWHNKTALESLALIASEVGEAVNECRGEEPTSAFSEELADIILRVFDLAVTHGVDLEYQIQQKMLINEGRGTRGAGVLTMANRPNEISRDHFLIFCTKTYENSSTMLEFGEWMDAYNEILRLIFWDPEIDTEILVSRGRNGR
jgi:NTP pyrophosphatase (non-canonical NTP hydrolase)